MSTLRRRYVNRRGDGNLVGAGLCATAATTTVVQVVRDGLGRCLYLTERQRWLGSRRAGQAALVTHILRARFTRAAWAVGNGAGHQTLLTIHRIAHVDGLTDGCHRKIGDDGA